ncbi:hypothetical protein [Saccharopolyspora rosea]
MKTPPPCGADTPAPQNTAAATVSSQPVPADEQQVAAQWDQWLAQQHLSGPNAKPDSANPVQMDHFTWYQTHGWTQPYPGENKIYAPADVPGAYIPSSDSDG